MESDSENLENIFEENDNDREADNAENVQANNENETSGVKIPVPKRIVRNPRLKFNPERLCGERGIPILVDHFKNVKFKGAGHEKEDLDKLLTRLEHWTHRLFPSMKFKDCLQHIEKLGKKRPVQTCLQKMRLNMPILNSDFVKDDDDDDDNVNRIQDSEPMEVDPFDRLIEENHDVLNPSVSVTENISNSNSMHSSPIQSSYGMGQVLGTISGSSSLTEEQRERMERNKMLAAERRKARLAALQQNSSEIQSVNEEAILSQKPPDSSIKSQETVVSLVGDSLSKSSQDNELCLEETVLELTNQNNSECLKLDDLIDLVDEEEPISDKNSAAMSSEFDNIVSSNIERDGEFSYDSVAQVNSPSSEQNINATITDNTNNKMLTTSDKISETANEENLGIESLLDLVDEDIGDM